MSLETDKAVVEVPSPWSGRIARLFGGKGDLIKVGAPLVEFAEGAAQPSQWLTLSCGVEGSGAPGGEAAQFVVVLGLEARLAGDLAQARGLWLHVDACVGGYLAPFVAKAGYPVPAFDFAVE